MCTMDSNTFDRGTTCVTTFNVNNVPLYVQILWKHDTSDLFHVKVFYRDECWAGKFSNDLADIRRERLDETAEVYSANVKQCLRGDGKDYVYDFIPCPNDANAASFVWKKRYEGALQIHGAVPLKREEFATSKDTLINILLEQNKKLTSDIDIANKANSGLKEDLKQYMQKMDELINRKISMEASLYGRFVQVLNEKKKRIRLLEDQIKNL